MINPSSIPVYEVSNSELSVVSALPFVLTFTPIFGTVVVKNAYGITLLAGVDYTVSHTMATVLFITPAIGDEVQVSYRYDGSQSLAQDAIDWLSEQLLTPLVSVHLTITDNTVALPDDAWKVVRVNACGCVPDYCRCGSECFDWQFNSPVLETAQNGEHTICYLRRVTMLTAPEIWLPCILKYIDATKLKGGQLTKESYKFGDESVDLGYSSDGVADRADKALLQCVDSLRRGSAFGRRHKGGLPCL